ncbi:MAG: hypothetical protein NC904_08555 [Candidatus Omnitrophica bacterium]|nr:hypothetical protein [Candidatus Omnitrophota bacterium]
MADLDSLNEILEEANELLESLKQYVHNENNNYKRSKEMEDKLLELKNGKIELSTFDGLYGINIDYDKFADMFAKIVTDIKDNFNKVTVDKSKQEKLLDYYCFDKILKEDFKIETVEDIYLIGMVAGMVKLKFFMDMMGYFLITPENIMKNNKEDNNDVIN